MIAITQRCRLVAVAAVKARGGGKDYRIRASESCQGVPNLKPVGLPTPVGRYCANNVNRTRPLSISMVRLYSSATGPTARISKIADEGNGKLDDVLRGITATELSIQEVIGEIAQVEEEIKKVQSQIEGVEEQLVKAVEPSEKQYLRDEKKQLRDKENKLRDKENKLLDEKKQLRDKENKLLDEKKQLREEKNKLLDQRNPSVAVAPVHVGAYMRL
jgi:hypothetical protein